MDFKTLYATLLHHKCFVFSQRDILSFYPSEKKESLKQALSRWRKKGWIQPLKKGLYELSYPEDRVLPDLWIANQLYSPSYVSLETALSYYSLIPEVSMAVTSVTTKPTRRFKNKHGLFIYRTVKPSAFTGYHVEQYRECDLLIAEPEKALVDYLYFKTCRRKKFDFAEERWDKKLIRRLERGKLTRYSKLYRMDWEEIDAHL